MTSVTNIPLLIYGEQVFTEQTLEVCDPGRLTDVVGHVAVATVDHVDQAVRTADAAYRAWRRVPLEQRLERISKMADRLEQQAETLARQLSHEAGMLLAVTRGELAMAVRAIRATVKHAECFFTSEYVEDDDSWVRVEKRPIGVVAGIVPWNAPMVLTMQKVAPALAAGNAIVVKPSPFAPMAVTLALLSVADLFPPGLVSVVHGEGDVGTALVKHPMVRKVSFTGGGRIAKLIMKDAADGLKGVHFELGGNDPAIVLDDANLDEVVPKIVGGVFRRSGQVCFAIKRVYIPDALYDAFFEQFCAVVDQYRIGHQLDERATFGPMNNANQFRFVQELAERIRQSEAQLVELGQVLEPDNWNNGYYLRPMVVRDAQPHQEIVTCEQFGPVIPLVRYRTEEELIRWINDTEYGLGSSIWTSDEERAVRLASEIEAGMTFVNGAGQSVLGHEVMPFGGVKQSGIGRENSAVGLAEFVEYFALNVHKVR